MKKSNTAIIVLFIGLLGFMYMHEQVHVEIYKSYGIKSHVEYFSHFPNVVTIPDKGCREDSCILAHNINEAISYPLMIVLSFFGVLFIHILRELEDG